MFFLVSASNQEEGKKKEQEILKFQYMTINVLTYGFNNLLQTEATDYSCSDLFSVERSHPIGSTAVNHCSAWI